MKKLVCITSISDKKEYVDIETNNGLMRVWFLTADIVRIKTSFSETLSEDASYILVLTAWKDRMDSMLAKERKRIKPYNYTFSEKEEYYEVATESLRLEISKNPFGLTIYNQLGHTIYEDVKKKAYMKDDQGRIYHYQHIQDTDTFYGFGEKSGKLNKYRRRLRMNNADTLGYDAEVSDPLYKHIPYYITANVKNKSAAGIFYHNSYPSTFDMGCERSAYWGRYKYFMSEDGDMDIFVINGPSIKDVVGRYTDLTGKSVLLPKYAYGYMGSTMYYTELDENADEAVLNFAEKTKTEKVPCSGFHLSSGYTTGEDGKRYVFNWNKKRFKDPGAFIQQMRDKEVYVSPNIKPGMLLSHPLYAEYSNNDAYIVSKETKKPVTSRYWGGDASFVDFTNPKGRDLWTRHMKAHLFDYGIRAFWNDNNEYEIDDDQAQCNYEDAPIDFMAIRPILPNLMAFTSYYASLKYGENERPYILNRAGFAGIQRYAQTWAGDNFTSWKNMKFNTSMMLGMGLSGVANQGVDIGGFDGPIPEPELLVRWIQNAMFHPRFSIHSCNTDNTVTEPWTYPEYTPYIRSAIHLRNQFMPYMYSLGYQAYQAGEPIMRPLVYEFQKDQNVYEESFDYMFGPFVLVAGIFEKGEKERKIYLPKGTSWYHWFSLETYEGGKEITIPVDLETVPLFFRAGSIIPQKKVEDELELLIEPWEKGEFTLYEDDGISNNYKKKDYMATHIFTESNEDKVTIVFEQEGNYKENIQKYSLTVVCKEKAPLKIRINGEELERYMEAQAWETKNKGWMYDAQKKCARIKYECVESKYSVDLDFSIKDLISI